MPELSENWTAAHPLVRIVRRRAHEYDFYQLLHIIEQVEADAAMVGQTGPPWQEPVRLRPFLGLQFPPGDIASADWVDNPLETTGHLRITLTLLGLYGSDSPLPAHFTESLLPEGEGDVRVREFIDLFHHRVFSLLFRVWKKYRYYVVFRSSGDDPISKIVRGFLGIGTPHLDQQLTVNPVRMFRYAGLLSQRPRSAIGLVGQLEDYFPDVPFDLEQCVGRWLRIQPGDRNRLGARKCTLGHDFLVGERMFDRSGKFRVKVGPVGFDAYTRFLPGGDALQDLMQVVRLYCDDPLDYDVEVTLKGDEVPDTPLGEHRYVGRLAWTSWLKSQPCEDKSVIFNPPKTPDKPDPFEGRSVPDDTPAAQRASAGVGGAR
ncbi:MAG: type VI secretion system baseplate subunit TssG [Planctomycetota bacterium]|nr:MAG: type VI secretion system baseplate subunit TssG [Planctomycetota bacterium]